MSLKCLLLDGEFWLSNMHAKILQNRGKKFKNSKIRKFDLLSKIWCSHVKIHARFSALELSLQAQYHFRSNYSSKQVKEGGRFSKILCSKIGKIENSFYPVSNFFQSWFRVIKSASNRGRNITSQCLMFQTSDSRVRSILIFGGRKNGQAKREKKGRPSTNKIS